MQQFSFDFGDPVFELDGWRLSFQLITFENTYGLDPALTRVDERPGGWDVVAEGLTWAGGRERTEGRLHAAVRCCEGGLEVRVGARCGKKIRCTKVIVSGLPAGEVVGSGWRRVPLTSGGTVLHYPGTIHTPLAFLASVGGGHIYIRSLDDRVRAKRIALYETLGALTVELLHEDAAHEMTDATEAPPWRFGRCPDPGPVVEEHARHLERAFGLRPWEERLDVPAWAREIALVVALHGMHWTGYPFHTYEQMLRALEWFAARIEGRRVLAFLPGWEGRYYWQYGDYRPEPRLGGPAGFRALAEGARRLGVKVMPMFGAHCANAGLENFEQWGAASQLRSAGGNPFLGNQPDWSGQRIHDTGWQRWLNPGAPAWRERLRSQVSRLVAEYDLPAAFLDTQHVWANDPSWPVYEGLAGLRDGLKSRFPDLLIAGEGWYDGLSAVTPVVQSGVPEGWPEIFGRYNRAFAHLMTGDPSRGSAGVHEAGVTGFWQVPEERWWWPTVTVVNGTLERAPERVEEVIARANAYVRRWL